MNIRDAIVSKYDCFTNTERQIADYFLMHDEYDDFSSKLISKKLFVSEASISRFAKKCGYKGYRQFRYEAEKFYNEYHSNINKMSNLIINEYRKILTKTEQLVDEEQLKRVAHILSSANVVIIYGIGSSGIASREIGNRFTRLGMRVQTITDSHMIMMSSKIASPKDVIVAISLSGETKEIINAIKHARQRNVPVIFISSNSTKYVKQYADEYIQVSEIDTDKPYLVSPQIPILIIMDIIYGFYENIDKMNKEILYLQTLSALNYEKNNALRVHEDKEEK